MRLSVMWEEEVTKVKLESKKEQKCMFGEIKSAWVKKANHLNFVIAIVFCVIMLYFYST